MSQFAADGAGGVRFRPAGPMGDDGLAALLATIEGHILTLLARREVRRFATFRV